MMPEGELLTLFGAAASGHSFRVPPATFAQFVAVRLDPELPPAEALAALNLPDLHLACGCVENIEGAAAQFMARFAPEIAQVASRFARSRGILADDLVQVVASRMLLPDGDHPARLALYRGKGPLSGFVRVTAARLALNATETKESRERRLDPEDGLFATLLSSPRTPEASLGDEQARALLRAAFSASAAQLEPRARNLLAYSVCDGLSIDAIGRLYNVHRSTAARWIESARDALVRGTRDALARELSETHVEALLRGGLSRFELSVTRCLREA